MHGGALTEDELRRWVVNRWCYQARIPIKDALILSKSSDPAFRRRWIRRVHDHDAEDGGLALWMRLAHAVGVDPDELVSERSVLPGVRFACDAYVGLVRDAPLVEAVASSLTEFFAPELLTRRAEAWERHYPFVDRAAGRGGADARAAGALRRGARAEDRDPVAPARLRPVVRVSPGTRPRLARRARLREDGRRGTVLLAPEEVYVLNPSAAAVLRLCDGRDVAEVVRALGAGDVAGDVIPFLQALADRGLLEEP